MTTAMWRKEEYKVKGEQLVARVRELVHEGNVRHVMVKDEKGHTILEIPLTVGVVSAVLVPVWVALGAIAALSAHFHLEVERHEK